METVNLLRAFFLLLAKTFLPFKVLIFFLNPCFLALRFFLGFQVLFIICVLLVLLKFLVFIVY